MPAQYYWNDHLGTLRSAVLQQEILPILCTPAGFQSSSMNGMTRL